MGHDRKLWFLDGRFLCRACQVLSYASQSESERQRHLRHALKIHRRLGSARSGAFPERPKGMWHRTAPMSA